MKFILSITPAAIMLALIFGGFNQVFKASCTSRWEGSKMATTYSFLGGCRVQLPDGTWIPEDRYRTVDGK